MPALVSGGPGNLTPDELLLRQQAAALMTGSPFPSGPAPASTLQPSAANAGPGNATWYGLGYFRCPRSIGDIVAHVTVSEEATDVVTITEHPVETNAAISDHAYINPPFVIIRCAWSNNRPEAKQNPNYIVDIYNKLLKLQASRSPFKLLTGRRPYDNMLIKQLHQTTDTGTGEDTLLITIIAQQVIIVNTHLVTVPDAAKSRMPDQLAGPTPSGERQAIPVGPGISHVLGPAPAVPPPASGGIFGP